MDRNYLRILNKRSLQGYSWVDGRLNQTQVTSRPETIWPEVWSSMSKCPQKKAKQQWDIHEPKTQVARQKRKNHDILFDAVEELDGIIQNAKQKCEIPGEPAMPCVSRKRIPAARTQTQKVAVSSVDGEDLR